MIGLYYHCVLSRVKMHLTGYLFFLLSCRKESWSKVMTRASEGKTVWKIFFFIQLYEKCYDTHHRYGHFV